jgi:alpha/beta superfamily hydrolase
MASGPSSNPLNQAIRSDPSGTRELFEFFGPGRQRLAGITYLPSDQVLTGVVMCPSIAADFAANYRWEVNQARHLCARGIAVQRFHYRGTGHSDGEPSDTTFATMCEDAVAASEHLQEVAAIEAMVVAGTRVGALVAAGVANRIGARTIVLIEPVVDSTRFFREGSRARLVHAVKDQRQGRVRTTNELLDEVNESGFVDLLGHSVHRALFASMSDLRLVDELPPGPNRLLLVQFGSVDQPRSEYQTLISAATIRDWVCDVVYSPTAEAWWFVQDEDDLGRESLPTITDWIEARARGIVT